jgi:3-dehydroquinate synthase
MAMVDSAVGGKTAVNHPKGKNMIGAFYQPQCVCVDVATLRSLPDRELCSGIAEIIKYGLIRDAEFFAWQEENMERLVARDPEALSYAIKRSCENKVRKLISFLPKMHNIALCSAQAEIVSADERDVGVRATLNLGHTFGHAIEAGVGYGCWLHGEAVASGMCMAAQMSVTMHKIQPELLQRIVSLVRRAQLPTTLQNDHATGGQRLTVDAFIELMSMDKKVANGELSLVLLDGSLGHCSVTKEYDHNVLKKTVESFVR